MKTISFILVLLGYGGEVPVSVIKQEVQAFYGQSVNLVIQDQLPKSAYYKPRNRYRADSILNYFKRAYPGKWVIGLTSKDISATTRGYQDYGIMGLGSLTEKVCISSTYRIRSGYKKEGTVKIILHEIGHTKGLQHCTSGQPCLMQEGPKIQQHPKAFCKSCRGKINL